MVLAAMCPQKSGKTEREMSRVCEFIVTDKYWNRVEGICNGYLHTGVILKGLDGFSAFGGTGGSEIMVQQTGRGLSRKRHLCCLTISNIMSPSLEDNMLTLSGVKADFSLLATKQPTAHSI